MLDKILDFRHQSVVLSIIGVLLHSIMSMLAVFFLYISIKIGSMDMIINSMAILFINLFIIFIYLTVRRGMKRMIEKDG